jgi:hypothetical protein
MGYSSPREGQRSKTKNDGSSRLSEIVTCSHCGKVLTPFASPSQFFLESCYS